MDAIVLPQSNGPTSVMAVWLITRIHSIHSLNPLCCRLEENNKIETPPDEKVRPQVRT